MERTISVKVTEETFNDLEKLTDGVRTLADVIELGVKLVKLSDEESAKGNKIGILTKDNQPLVEVLVVKVE